MRADLHGCVYTCAWVDEPHARHDLFVGEHASVCEHVCHVYEYMAHSSLSLTRTLMARACRARASSVPRAPVSARALASRAQRNLRKPSRLRALAARRHQSALRFRQRQEPGWSCQPSARGRPASSGCGRRRTALGNCSDICHESDMRFSESAVLVCTASLENPLARLRACRFHARMVSGRVRTSGCWQSSEAML